MLRQKSDWIKLFRDKADEIMLKPTTARKNKKDQAGIINKEIMKYKEDIISDLKSYAETNELLKDNLLKEILMITYSSYIVMLEYRNKVWEYEYMAFARRIGELWEPFCKLTFEYPVKQLKLIDPPDFNDVQNSIRKSAVDYINSLNLTSDEKKELMEHYNVPWDLVDSGGIKLGLDLHFNQDGINYNCDFKSGFSSNEKGNTNRLLLVGSIYNSLGEIEKTILFVRQSEDENNHYLQTLKNSPYWEVFCADDTYSAMERFTGFNLRHWLDTNVDWENDISTEFKRHLVKNDLLKYLTW